MVERRRRRRRRAPVLLAGAAAVALLIVVGLALRSGGTRPAAERAAAERAAAPGTGSSAPASPTPTVSAGASATTSSADDPAVSRAIAACRETHDRGHAAVDRLQVALGDWSTHLATQTKLSAGDISAAQARRAWARTRAAGPGDVERFDAADRRVTASSAACRAPAQATGTTRAGLVACAEDARVVGATLREGRRSMAQWKDHLTAMADTRAGRVSGHTAAGRWHEAWKDGRAQLAHYRAVSGELRRTSCTP